jgi:hypothetical protein
MLGLQSNQMQNTQKEGGMTQDSKNLPEPAKLDLSKYASENFNVLSPILQMDSAAPYLRLRIVEVRLSADPNKGDCYAAPGSRWEKDSSNQLMPVNVAPAKPALLKISSAAGLVIDTTNSRRITPSGCERCIEMARASGKAVRCGDCPCKYDVAYQYVGAIRTETGWQIFKSTYEWELEAQRRKIVREAKKKAADYPKKIADAKQYNRPAPPPFDEAAHIEDRVDQVISERFGLAETKALLRLIRAICHVRQAYGRHEFAKPFVVVRTELAPDMADPETRRQLAAKAAASGADIFGTAAVGAIKTSMDVVDAVSSVVQDLAQGPDFVRTPAVEVSEPAEVEAPAEEAEQHAAPPAQTQPQQPQGSEAGGQGSGTPQTSDGEGQDEEMVVCGWKGCGEILGQDVIGWCDSPKGKQLYDGQRFCRAHQREYEAQKKAQEGGGS